MTNPDEAVGVEENETLDRDDEQMSPQEDVGGEESPAKLSADDVEAEARFFGWKAPDEWRGEQPPGYIDNPQDYLDRLERSTPFRKLKEHSEEKLRKLESVMDAARQRDLERQKQDYEARLQAIANRQRAAVESADVEEWDRLEKVKQNLVPPKDDLPQTDPVEPFKSEYTWLEDAVIRDHGAKAIDAAMRSGELASNADVATQVKFADAQVRKYFPHLFKTEEAPKPQPRVDGGGLAGPRKKSGFDSLPKDVKAEFDRQVKKGVFENTTEDREFFFDEYQNG